MSNNDQCANIPNAWTNPLAAYINQLGKLRPKELLRLWHQLNSFLRWEARTPGYADWLMPAVGGSPVALPEDPSPRLERAALDAILRGLISYADYSEQPALQPDQLSDLIELHARAIRAVKDRIRHLETGALDADEWSKPVNQTTLAKILGSSPRTVSRQIKSGELRTDRQPGTKRRNFRILLDQKIVGEARRKLSPTGIEIKPSN
jgi:hypothetical protein